MNRRSPLLAAALLLTCCGDGGGGEPGLTSHSLDGRPSAIAYDADHEQLWVVDDGRDVAQRYDLDGEPIGDPIPLDAEPIAVDVNDGSLWIAHAGGTVTRLDVNDGSPGDPVDVGAALVDVVAGEDGTVWVGDIGSGTVEDLSGGEIVVPGGVVRLALDPDADTLWVTNLEDTVTPVDLGTRRAGEPVDVGAGPIGVTVDGDRVYVANGDDDTVSLVGGATTAVGDAPIAVEVVDGDVWVLNQDGQSVQPLERDGADSAVALGCRPRGFVAAGGSLWVVGVEPSALVEVDVSS